jgi:hypothetical protein
MKAVKASAAIVATLFAGIALAHHGWSSYEAGKTLKLSGTIEELSYENPHGIVKLKTPTESWTVVLAPVSRMEARGLNREMLKPGTSVSVEGYPHSTQTGELRAERITVEKKSVELR